VTERVRLGIMVTILPLDLQVRSSNTRSKNSPGCGGETVCLSSQDPA